MWKKLFLASTYSHIKSHHKYRGSVRFNVREYVLARKSFFHIYIYYI